MKLRDVQVLRIYSIFPKQFKIPCFSGEDSPRLPRTHRPSTSEGMPHPRNFLLRFTVPLPDYFLFASLSIWGTGFLAFLLQLPLSFLYHSDFILFTFLPNPRGSCLFSPVHSSLFRSPGDSYRQLILTKLYYSID